MGDHFLRLNISSQTSSGVAWFDVEENSGDKQHFIFILKSINAYLFTGLQRTIVQSIFPDLSPPILTTNKSSLSLLTDEDVVRNFNLEEIIVLNEAISTRTNLKEFQMCK